MATRMQQRRGTAAQWLAAAPVVLAAGEIGFETDTNQFKMGDGTTEWQVLSYFKNLEDLGGSLDDYIPLTQKGIAGGVPTLDSNGVIPLAQIPGAQALDAEVTSAVSAATSALETSIQTVDEKVDTKHGVAMASIVSSISAATQTEITRANAAYDAFGAAATAQSAAATYAEGQKTAAVTEANQYTDTEISAATTTEQGLRNTAISTAVADEATARNTAIEDAIDAEVILRDAAIATQSGLDRTYTNTAVSTLSTTVDGNLTTHIADTTNIHGIADTSVLATATTVATAKSEAIAAAGTAADTKVSTAVAALTKSSVGLGDVDNTADTAKPVSTAQATAIATAKSEAIADATSQVNALLTGAPAALNTLDELAAALGDDANFASTVTTNLAAKAPLASPTFTGTVTLPAAGIVFSDGTQAKAGVPSITTFGSSFAASATLAEGEQDKFVPVAGTVVITLPASGYSTGQSVDFYQASGTGASFASTNSVVGTPGLKFRTTNSVVTAMKTSSGWLVFGDLSA